MNTRQLALTIALAAATLVLACACYGPGIPAAGAASADVGAEGLSLFNQGKWQEAAAALEDAVTASPEDTGLSTSYAIALLQARDYQRALDQLQELMKKHPDARLFRSLADTVAAERAGSNRKPDSVPAPAPPQMGFGVNNVVQNVQPVDTSIALLEESARQHPDSAAIANLLGDAYQLKGSSKQAELWYRKATALAPGWVKPIMGLGIASIDSDTPRGANLLEQAAAMEPDNPRIKMWLGDAYSRLGKLPEATRLYAEAANSQQTASEGKVRLGTVYLQTNQTPAAAKAYSEAAQIDSSNVAAQLGQAQALAVQQQAAPAQEALDLAISNSYTLSDRGRANVYYNDAQVRQEVGDFGNAITNYSNAIELDPTLQPAYRNLAVTLKTQGKLEQAIAEHEAKLRQSPGDVSTLRFLAEGYHAQGNAPKQLVVLGRLAKLEPENRWCWTMRQAEALWDSGNRAAAAAKWRAAVDIGYPTRTSVIARSVISRPGAVQAVVKDNDGLKDRPGTKAAADARIWHLQYAIAEAQGNLAAALERLNAVIKADPDNDSLYGQRGFLLQKLGRQQEASTDFDSQRELLMKHPASK